MPKEPKKDKLTYDSPIVRQFIALNEAMKKMHEPKVEIGEGRSTLDQEVSDEYSKSSVMKAIDKVKKSDPKLAAACEELRSKLNAANKGDTEILDSAEWSKATINPKNDAIFGHVVDKVSAIVHGYNR